MVGGRIEGIWDWSKSMDIGDDEDKSIGDDEGISRNMGDVESWKDWG